MRNEFIIGSILSLLGVATLSIFHSLYWLHSLWILGRLIIQGVIDLQSKSHTIIANYPIFGRLRYVMEDLRPKIYQYFIESDTDGTPINRVDRSVVYQRGKRQLDTTHLGLKLIFIARATNGLITA